MALDLFGDFGFAAGSDETANPYQDAQRLINWYVEVSPSQVAKMPTALLGCPGLIPLIAAPGGGAPGFSEAMTEWPVPSNIVNLPVRGFWVLPGSTQSLAVIGNACYLVTYGSTGSRDSSGSLSLSHVGILATSVGPVCIRDNGTDGNFALIVDGTYGYLYSIKGPTSVSFGAELATGSAVVTLPAEVPIGIAIGSGTIVSSANRGLPVGTSIESIDYSAGTLTLSAASTITNSSDTLTESIPRWVQLTDPGFLGADTVAYIDGWWILNCPGTQTFYTNAQPYALNFDPAYYANKDAASDILICVIENKEELWLIGERTTEIWYDAGGAFFPFARLVGTLLQTGSKAVQSACQISANGTDSLIWLGRNVQGEAVVVITSGFSWVVVSTPAVSHALASYSTLTDALGYVYEEDSHVFYVLTFPTADRTLVYDATLPPQYAWHERLSYDPYADQWHRHRSNCYMNFAGMRVVGDYQNGTLYQLTRASKTDAGWPLRAVRRSPYVWAKSDRERVFLSQFQIDFTLGKGTASGLGSYPKARLRISRDYGATYGQYFEAPMGAQGQTLNRCIWRRLGFSRGAVLEVEVIDPVGRDIAGVTLRAASP